MRACVRAVSCAQWSEFWVQVSCSDRFTAAIGRDGNVYTWGLNDKGQTGQNPVGLNVMEPQIVMALFRIQAYKVNQPTAGVFLLCL